MTPQEQQMIQSLADRINNTPLPEKDPDAEQFLQQALGRNPDALYILAQTTLVQQYALTQAQQQLADTRTQLNQQRQQAQQPKHATSFLGNLLGLNDSPTPQPAPPPPPQYAPVSGYVPAGGPGYGPPQPYGQPQYGQPQYGQPQPGGFLRSAMQTATGVAAGALAFEGIESLMHGFGGGQPFGGGGFGAGRPEEIINNNYYGDQAPAGHHDQLSPDIEDRRDQPSSFGDAVDRNDHGDTSSFFDTASPDGSGADSDDSSFSDPSLSDSASDDSNFDDGGSSDDSSFDSNS